MNDREKHLVVHGVSQEKELERRGADVAELLQSTDGESDPNRALSRCLFVLFKQTTLYELDNAALQAPVERTLKQIQAFLERDGVLSVQRRVDGVYVNNALLPRDTSLEELYPFLESVYERLTVHEMVFLPALDESGLRTFLQHFQKLLRGSGNPGDYRWPQIHLRSLPEEKAREERRERERVVASYAVLCVRVGEVFNALAQGKRPQLASLKRALKNLLDLSLEHEGVLVATLPLTREKDTPWGHAVNCAVLVGMMAKRLGAPRRRLLSVAMAAVLHDVGLALPPGGEPWRRAMGLLLQIPGQGAELATRLVAMRECATGAPPAANLGALARLLAVAHAYDLLITGSPTRAPLTPEQAVRILSAESGRRYDPAAFALLAQSVGFLPPGSLLQLSTGELAVPLSVPADPKQWMAPTVRLLDAAGKPGAVVDLAGPEAGGRKVARSLAPRELGLNPLPVLL